MKPAPAAMLGCLLGGVVTFVAVRLADAGVVPVPAPVDQSGSREPTDADRHDATRVVVPASSSVELGPVLDRLDALAAEVQRLSDTFASLPAMRERQPVASTGAAVVDADSLAAAMSEIERRRIDAMSDEELLQEARVALKSGRLGDAIANCERLVARAGTPEQRAAALTELALMQRAQKGADGVLAAESTLLRVIDEFGAGSEPGRTAAYQLIWTVPKGDAQRGLAHAQAYLADPGLTPGQRLQGRWALAIQQSAAGDREVARAGFEQLLREIDGQPVHAKLAADIRQRLAGK